MSEIKTEWNLGLIGEYEDDFFLGEGKKIEDACDAFVSKWRSNKFLESSVNLLKALDDYESFFRNFGSMGNLGYSYSLKQSLDEANTEIKAKLGKIENFGKNIENKLSFFKIRLGKLSLEKQNEFLKDSKLWKYKHFLELVFESGKYTLGEEEEKILNLKERVAHDSWVNALSGMISKEEREVLVAKNKEKEKVSFSILMSMLDDKEKEVRESAFEAIQDIFGKLVDVGESELNAVMLNKKINDELRGFERADKKRHMGDDVDSDSVDSLLSAVTERFDIPKRFYNLKAKLLGLDKLRYFEKSLDFGEIDGKIEYGEAVKIVESALTKLDKDFVSVFRKFVEDGNIDVYPKKGKRSGAFCEHYLISQPTYILLNYSDKIRDVAVLAHEVGHGINSELMKRKQNALSYGMPKSTAEVQSTFIEGFVYKEIADRLEGKEKLALSMKVLGDNISTIFRQIAFYNFELELHEKFRENGYLSKEEIGVLFRKHMESYLGDAVDCSGSENWWIYVPHFRYFFYVYSYAMGLLASKAMTAEYEKDNRFIEKIKDFYMAGKSVSTKDLFLSIGIDISKKKFWEKGLKNIESELFIAEKLAKNLNLL